MKWLESECCPSFLFHSLVVLFNDIIEVFTLPNFNRRSRFLVIAFDSSGVSTAFIYIYFHRSTVVAYGLAKKRR